MTPGEKDALRNDIADWLFQHEDDEHNALPHSEAADSVQVQYDAKVYGWADELLSGPLAPLLAKLRAVQAVLDEAEQVMEPGGIALVVTARVRRALDAS